MRKTTVAAAAVACSAALVGGVAYATNVLHHEDSQRHCQAEVIDLTNVAPEPVDPATVHIVGTESGRSAQPAAGETTPPECPRDR